MHNVNSSANNRCRNSVFNGFRAIFTIIHIQILFYGFVSKFLNPSTLSRINFHRFYPVKKLSYYRWWFQMDFWFEWFHVEISFHLNSGWYYSNLTGENPFRRGNLIQFSTFVWRKFPFTSLVSICLLLTGLNAISFH